MRRRWTHWLWLVLFVALAAGLWRLRLDVEILNLLPASSPAARGLRLYQEHFASARELIVTVRAGSAEDAEIAARRIAGTLRGRADLAARVLWQPPWIEQPGQMAELTAFLWLNQPPGELARLAARLEGASLTNTLLEARETLATGLSPADLAARGYDPFGLTKLPADADAPSTTSGEEFFASADGTFRVLFVEAAPNLASYRACAAWLAEVRQAVNATRAAAEFPTGVTVDYTGRPAFVAEIAGGMERDMFGSVGGTLAVVAALFFRAHRRWRPLLWLVALLAFVLIATTVLGGLIYGNLNVVSMGFAAILLGLAADYGLVLYQESRAAPGASATQLRRETGAGIVWSAVTTAGAFLTLNLSALPGLAQLGTLVAVGIGLAAVVMLFAYLPPLLKGAAAGAPVSDPARVSRPVKGGTGDSPVPSGDSPLGRGGSHSQEVAVRASRVLPVPSGQWPDGTGESPVPPKLAAGVANDATDTRPARRWPAFAGTAFLVALSAAVFIASPPRFDKSTEALRPRTSAAHAALDELKLRLGHAQEPDWLLLQGRDEAEVARSLTATRPLLELAVTNGAIDRFTLPAALWPSPEHQSGNRPALAALASRRTTLRDAALGAGFTREALGLTEAMFDVWERALGAPGVFWPTNAASAWVLGQFAARGGEPRLRLPLARARDADPECLALGLVYAGPRASGAPALEPWTTDGPAPLLTGWRRLGAEVFAQVTHDLPRVLLPMAVLLLVSLWCAFRRAGEVLFSLMTLALSALLLHAVMALAGWSWNLINLMALPLLLGAGVDYAIHMQLALRRHGGHAAPVRRGVGRALFLCAATTVAGFGSLGFSSNAGLASLGQVCAAGVACAWLTATLLLPVWWRAAFLRPSSP